MTEEHINDLRDLLNYLEGRMSPPYPNVVAADCVRAALKFIDETRNARMGTTPRARPK